VSENVLLGTAVIVLATVFVFLALNMYRQYSIKSKMIDSVALLMARKDELEKKSIQIERILNANKTRFEWINLLRPRFKKGVFFTFYEWF
jgi:hypothetical protein